MENPRLYGKPPYRVAVLHGGPGAPGTMAPVARELSRTCGVLEPLQTAPDIDGQLLELQAILSAHAVSSVTLIGHSWGAWLGVLFAARWPRQVQKLILVGSGPFEEQYAQQIMETRLGRLEPDEQTRVRALLAALDAPGAEAPDGAMAQLGQLLARTDAFDPLPPAPADSAAPPAQSAIYHSVWPEARRLRQSGRLLELASRIQCPVLAIHGDFDPHPAAGVEGPLSRVLANFQFVRLPHCGHEPWAERQARAPFFEILRDSCRDTC